jgi:hypothetical protein
LPNTSCGCEVDGLLGQQPVAEHVLRLPAELGLGADSGVRVLLLVQGGGRLAGREPVDSQLLGVDPRLGAGHRGELVVERAAGWLGRPGGQPVGAGLEPSGLDQLVAHQVEQHFQPGLGVLRRDGRWLWLVRVAGVRIRVGAQ